MTDPLCRPHKKNDMKEGAQPTGGDTTSPSLKQRQLTPKNPKS